MYWCSRKQPTISLSTTEAEYVAASEASRMNAWIHNLLNALGCTNLPPTPLLCDNRTAIQLCGEQNTTDRRKHINVKYHFIRQEKENKKIDVVWVCTTDQLADILAKALPITTFIALRDRISTLSDPQAIVSVEANAGIIVDPTIFIDIDNLLFGYRPTQQMIEVIELTTRWKTVFTDGLSVLIVGSSHPETGARGSSELWYSRRCYFRDGTPRNKLRRNSYFPHVFKLTHTAITQSERASIMILNEQRESTNTSPIQLGGDIALRWNGPSPIGNTYDGRKGMFRNFKPIFPSSHS